jgi:tRNA pseudouridine synthase 9
MVEEYEKRRAEKMTGELCGVCDTPLYSDPGVHELGIYLHARRYECEEGRWAYETGLPGWALPPPGVEGPTELTKETEPSESLLKAVKGLAIEEREVPAEEGGVVPPVGAVA